MMGDRLTASGPLEAGSRTADFTLHGTDGKPYASREARADGLLLIALFKTSCGTCKYAFPYLQRFHAQYAQASGGRFQVWGVSQDDAETTGDFARENGNATFPILLDSDLSVTAQYGIANVPDLYLLGPGETIQSAILGHFSSSGFNDLARAIASALNAPYSPVVREEDGAPDLKPG